jgi:intermembrane space import and assembly protein 40
MSYCKEFGKDKIIFVTKEDHEKPPTVSLSEDDEDRPPGLILPNGEINWNCPCLGGMATGPCGVEFRDAFSCFHFSEAEPKGSDCIEKFSEMQSCMTKYPALYGKLNEPDEEEEDVLSIQEEEEEKTAAGEVAETMRASAAMETTAK